MRRARVKAAPIILDDQFERELSKAFTNALFKQTYDGSTQSFQSWWRAYTSLLTEHNITKPRWLSLVRMTLKGDAKSYADNHI